MSSVTALSNDDIRDLYRELILDHARQPRHYGVLAGATHSAEGINPLCGDKLHLHLRVDDAGVVRDVAFEGSGCAISVASASLLTDEVLGLSRENALAKMEQVTGALRGEATADELGKLNALLGVREFPSRVKCASLAWHALSAALGGRRIASTEN